LLGGLGSWTHLRDPNSIPRASVLYFFTKTFIEFRELFISFLECWEVFSLTCQQVV